MGGHLVGRRTGIKPAYLAVDSKNISGTYMCGKAEGHMAQLASTLVFMLLFMGCGVATQRMIADHFDEVIDALRSFSRPAAKREFRVVVRPARLAAARRGTA
jgi:hypothetical protein